MHPAKTLPPKKTKKTDKPTSRQAETPDNFPRFFVPCLFEKSGEPRPSQTN